eukprot:scaffold1860_cov403-Prasinococcus_capsulatus_cf.AAC.12
MPQVRKHSGMVVGASRTRGTLAALCSSPFRACSPQEHRQNDGAAGREGLAGWLPAEPQPAPLGGDWATLWPRAQLRMR